MYAKEIKEALSASAIATRLAEAKLISAKAEVEASRYRKQAADQFSSQQALQFIYLEHLGRLAESTHHSKVYILPATMNGITGMSAALGNNIETQQILALDHSDSDNRPSASPSMGLRPAPVQPAARIE